MGDAKRIEQTLRVVMGLLVRGEFHELERLTGGTRLPALAIEQAIREYGPTLKTPPPPAWSQLDVVRITGSQPPRYSVRFHFYTEEEGMSDLELQATLGGSANDDLLSVELDNILVA